MPAPASESLSLAGRIRDCIEPSVEAMGYGLVQVKLSDGKKRRLLQIMAERHDGSNMSFDDCSQISHAVSALLDVEDPITGAYSLEVCSPGLDRPLSTPRDFERFLGHEAKVETVMPIEERKRFRGAIAKVTPANVEMNTPEGEAVIEWGNIRSAKLIVTEDLLRQSLSQSKPEGKKNHLPNQTPKRQSPQSHLKPKKVK